MEQGQGDYMQVVDVGLQSEDGCDKEWVVVDPMMD